MNAPNNKREKFARFGIATKGMVYILIGGLTAMTAFGMGGKKTGSTGVLEFLGSQTYGQIILVITAIGLLGYTFFRLYQAIRDPQNKGNDTKGIVIRAGYVASGLFYAALSFVALRTVFGFGSSGSGGSRQSAVAMLLDQPFGQVLVGLLAVIFLGKAIFQFYQAYSGRYKERVNAAGLNQNAHDIVLKAGKIGFTARGIVIGIIAFLTFRAAITASSSSAGGTKEAFQYLQNEFGTIVLAVIALGLLAYGVFMFVKAKYSQIAMH